MEELEQFLIKQRDLNLKLIEEMIQNQSLLQHNLSIGLQSLRLCMEQLPNKIFSKKIIQSKVTLNRQLQHSCILSHLQIQGGLIYISLDEDLKEIYRERMFNMGVSLRNQNGDVVDEEICNIYLKIYTSERFPKEVNSNIKGKPILKGQIMTTLKGKVELQKIQITEVSSHYPSGKFIIVIFSDKNYIKPLILDNVIVKAKKISK